MIRTFQIKIMQADRGYPTILRKFSPYNRQTSSNMIVFYDNDFNKAVYHLRVASQKLQLRETQVFEFAQYKETDREELTQVDKLQSELRLAAGGTEHVTAVTKAHVLEGNVVHPTEGHTPTVLVCPPKLRGSINV